MSNVFEETRFCIHTFGCQMNKHDSERVAGMLEGLGSLPVETIEEADIVVFMTCCVREAADTRLYGQVASMKNIPLRDGTPLDKRYIAVGGCIGQRDGDKLLAALPHLDVVFGTHNLGSLPGLLRRAIEQHGRAAEVIEGGAEFSSALPTVREHDWAAWLPITVGCNNFCSYCIVPYVRGREKSRPLDDIAAEARSYVEAGVKEITLLGQNVNSYGRDLYGEPRFADVLRAVDAAGIERLRFATSHPKDLTDEVIGLFSTLPSLMPALHLPVQSGSNRILSAMNRRYTREHYLGLIEKLRCARPDIALSTDIIVGFPGEGEEEFEELCRLLPGYCFQRAGVFTFSAEEGAPAAALPDQVPEDVAKHRMELLVDLQSRVMDQWNEDRLGTVMEVLCEGFDGDMGCWVGRTYADSPDIDGHVYFTAAGQIPAGTFVNVRITGTSDGDLTGEIEE